MLVLLLMPRPPEFCALHVGRVSEPLPGRLRCQCRPVCRIARDPNRTACTGRGRRGAVSLPPVLELVPRERRACDSIRYFVLAPSAGPARGQAEAGRQGETPGGFPPQWLPFRRQFSPSFVR
jgi:hypothetical protein